MQNLFRGPTLKNLVLFGTLLAATRLAPAQALATADRGAQLAPFVQTSLVYPDWGPTTDLGLTAGVDYTRFIRSIVQPSLEIRFNNVTGQVVNEHSFTGGLKLQTTVHHLHPYFTVLGGKGFIDFVHPANNYISDSSFIYSLGAGATIPIQSRVDLLFDFTHSQWDIGPQTLTPVTLNLGVAYRIGLRGGRQE